MYEKNTQINQEKNELRISFNNYKNLNHTIISITSDNFFVLSNTKREYISQQNSNSYVVDIEIRNGNNIFTIVEKGKTDA